MKVLQNRILQGDCVELLEQLTPGTVDLAFADPPFNIGYEYDVYDDAREAQEYLDWCRQWIGGVYRALKPDGTFWLAIGDEFAAELKIEAQRQGFHCRSWVIWYYTFGVNCSHGFSRSHTHLFHFVKDRKQFTFNRFNPQIRVKSARQLVYADKRANPDGRLPDNTWITRPQDAPLSFSPNHDTWYFARVAGTFKEREGFHGCQMPEQLLARIIRACSHPQDLVLDPFGGSGTTLCVAKKLARRFLGFELSDEYAKYIQQRLDRTQPGDPIDGPEDPVQSAPPTKKGRRKKSDINEKTEAALVQAFSTVADGSSPDDLLCVPSLNQRFVTQCKQQKIGGAPHLWNRWMLQLKKSGKLPKATQPAQRLTAEQFDQYSSAAEIAWRLLAIDYHKTLDELFCSPEFAAEFDRLAQEFGPPGESVESSIYRSAAIAVRRRSDVARTDASSMLLDELPEKQPLSRQSMLPPMDSLNGPGAFVLYAGESPVYAGQSKNVRGWLQAIGDNPQWHRLEIDAIGCLPQDGNQRQRLALKAALVQREQPMLNCPLLICEHELPVVALA